MLRLNIGSGGQKKPGYVNIDLYAKRVDLQCSAHHIPYETGSVDEIYTSHMIEHLTPKEFGLALKEWKRLLKPGGRLIIRCPNFELYVKEWLEGDYKYRWGLGGLYLFGRQNLPGYSLCNGFTVKRLHALLIAAGFQKVNVRRCVTRMKYGPEARKYGDLCATATR